MAKTIVICGHGPGISHAVARKFGKAGFQVALVARSADKLSAAAKALEADGISARAFPGDLGDPAKVQALFAEIAKAFGPVTVVHWNAYVGAAGDLLTSKPEELRSVLAVGVEGLVYATQAALPGMTGQPDAAILVTGGGFSAYDVNVDKMIVQFGAMGLGVMKAAQHKLVRILNRALTDKGVYVGEVTVLGMVKGTAFDSGQATIEAATVAELFFKLYQERTDLSVPCA
jgi:NADP-dependent 3-hydroxy acid dehydrogenase YdfG